MQKQIMTTRILLNQKKNDNVEEGRDNENIAGLGQINKKAM